MQVYKTVLLVPALLWLSASASQAANCPSGQKYRTSLKICVSASEFSAAMHKLQGKPIQIARRVDAPLPAVTAMRPSEPADTKMSDAPANVTVVQRVDPPASNAVPAWAGTIPRDVFSQRND